MTTLLPISQPEADAGRWRCASCRISHQGLAVQIHGTRSYGVCRCLLPDRPRSREQDCHSDRSRRGVHSQKDPRGEGAPWPRSDVNDKKVPDRVGSVVFVIQKCSPVGDSLGRICRSCHYVLSRSVRLAVILRATTPRATSRTCSRNQACEGLHL
jgi:hypothetical protein